jgi:HEAT repeat protein
VRRAAIEHLPYFEDARGAEALAQALKNDTPRVRAAAAASMAYSDKLLAVAHLLEALNDDDPWVRYFAARSLGRHRATESTESLSGLARADKFNHVRIAALEALGRLGGEQALAVATSLIEAGDPDLVRAALAALGQMRHQQALRPLIEATRSPDASIRVSAIAALGERGGEGVLEDLQRAVMDEDPVVFETAIRVLGRVGSAEAIAGLIALVADPLRRDVAITTLAHAGAQVEQVANGLFHQKPEVRRGIVEALARMKRERASELLKSVALQDSDATVHLAAASALGLSLRLRPSGGPGV